MKGASGGNKRNERWRYGANYSIEMKLVLTNPELERWFWSTARGGGQGCRRAGMSPIDEAKKIIFQSVKC